MLPTKIFFTLTMLMAGALALTCVQPNNPTTVDVYDSSVSGTAVSATAIPESDIDEVLHDDEEKEDGDNETISGVVPDTTDEEDVVFEPAWGEASSNDTEVEPENRLARRKAKPCKCAKGTASGLYCGLCDQVLEKKAYGHVYQCNPRGGCYDYGVRKSCQAGAGPCGDWMKGMPS